MEAVKRRRRFVGVIPLDEAMRLTSAQVKARVREGWVMPIAGGAPATVEDLRARNDEIKLRLNELDGIAAGRTLSEEEKAEWNKISSELEDSIRAIDEMERRRDWLKTIEGTTTSREAGAHFGVSAARSQVDREDIWDLTTLRSYTNPDEQLRQAHDRCKRAIEDWQYPHPEVQRGAVSRERIQQHLLGLLSTSETPNGDLARYLLRVGSPIYSRAFGKEVLGQALTTEETRALADSTGSAGGYALPITIDPTIIPISNGVVNPIRALARTETIVGMEYRGLTAGAVVASYVPEGTEASDNSPTLAQPDLNVERATTFVPYSIEIGMDWVGLQAGMAQLIGDAKDVLEGNKFTLGAGHTAHEPSGLITGATDTVLTAGSAAFAVADLYNLEQNLPPRFRPKGQWFASRYMYNQVRQFGVAASEALWQPLMNPNTGPLGIGLANRPFGEGGNLGTKLLGYGANEVSDMAANTSTGSTLVAIGDPNYYLIVDRIGLTVELIPTLFGGSGRPTGQRGLFAYWRNTGAVVDPNAFRCLVGR